MFITNILILEVLRMTETEARVLARRKYTEKNKEKIAEYQKKYRAEHKEKINQDQKKHRERQNERNSKGRKSLYKVETGYSITPNMATMERNARTKWFENYIEWEEIKKWKKITLYSIKYDVIQATNNFLTICEHGKRHSIQTISKVDFYLKKNELGAEK